MSIPFLVALFISTCNKYFSKALSDEIYEIFLLENSVELNICPGGSINEIKFLMFFVFYLIMKEGRCKARNYVRERL